MAAMAPIYLDYNATTPIDPAVREAMLPYLGPQFGNPSSTHVLGRASHDAVERARTQVAALLRAHPDEIVFTGGGSEASNHAIKGLVFQRWQPGRSAPHVVTTAVEHPATLKPCDFLGRLGCSVTILPVDQYGQVDPAADRPGLGHARQQRGRHVSADPRDRGDRPRARRPNAHRCGPVGRQNAGRC
jgi:cysteine desulfurase